MGSQPFFERAIIENLNNQRNLRENLELRSRAGSCYLNHKNNCHGGSAMEMQHDYFNVKRGRRTRPNSYYGQEELERLPRFDGPAIYSREVFNSQTFVDDEVFEEQKQYSGWNLGIDKKIRPYNCLESPRIYQRQDMQRKYRPEFPPFPEIESRSRTRSFYTNDNNEVSNTPRDEVINFPKRDRSKTFFEEPPSVDKLSILDQAKLKTKYKRIESKEALCAADYVKLKRPHSADDINKIYAT